MLEKLGSWVLNYALGDYLVLNTEQLSVGILSGHLELENIPIKKAALDKFELPMEVVSGKVSKMSLSIPMSSLRSQPWVINIKDVHLILGPHQLKKPDMVELRAQIEQNKKRMLNEMEERWNIEREPDVQSDSTYNSWFSYYSSGIISSIVENLQLKLEGLHIRYEDYSKESKTNFAFGLVIDRLVTQSTDSQWKPQYSSMVDSIVYKIVSLDGLSLYWLSKTEHLKTVDRRMNSMFLPTNCTYILKPVSAVMYLKRNTSTQPLRAQDEARMSVDIKFKQILLSLSDDQYRGVSILVKEFEQFEKRKPYLLTRPNTSPKHKPRQWWIHVIECILGSIRERNRRLNEDFISERCRDNVVYFQLYCSYLAGEKLDHHENRNKQRIEKTYTYTELKILRQLAVNRLKTSGQWIKQTVPRSASSTGYLSGWVGWALGRDQDESSVSSSNTSLPDTQKPISDSKSLPRQLNLTSSERQALEAELNNLIGPTEGGDVESASALNKDSIFLYATFQLDHAMFKLTHTAVGKEDENNGIIALECSHINSSLTLKPRSHSSNFTLTLGSLLVKDLYHTTSIFPLLVSPRHASWDRSMLSSGLKSSLYNQTLLSPPAAIQRNEDKNIFSLEIQKNPHSLQMNKKDLLIRVETEPLDIIYNDDIVNSVKQFFSSTSRLSAEASQLYLTERARRKYEKLKNRTKIDIRDTWDKLINSSLEKSPKRVGLNLNICAPQIIIPECMTDKNTHMLILDLGRVIVNNSEPKSSDSQQSLNDIEDDDFVTPPSSPPNEENVEIAPISVLPCPSEDSIDFQFADSLNKQMYDRYEVHLTDIQMLTVNASDKWRIYTNKGFSHLHIIDKLNLDLLFERRLIQLADPDYPAIRLSAIFENISLHLSEMKINRILTCIEKLTINRNINVSATQQEPSVVVNESISATLTNSDSRFFTSTDTRAVIDNSKMCVCSVNVYQLTMELSNQDCGLVEMSVTGVKADFRHLPTEQSLSLKLHSLIIADLFQKYGAEYDCLLASHRKISLDKESGSITGSSITSPTSPQSPSDPLSPPPESNPTLSRKYSNNTFSKHFQTAVLTKLLPVAAGTPHHTHSSTSSFSASLDKRVYEGDPLVSIEFKQTHTHTQTIYRHVDVVFNTLDIVANQETLVEIGAFFHRSFPQSQTTHSDNSKSDSTQRQNDNKTSVGNRTLGALTNIQDSLNLQAEFRKLSVLLHRPSEDGSKLPVKVATLSMTGAKILATLDEDLRVESELGSLKINGLSPHTVHSQVFSFGTSCEETNLDQTVPAHMYQTCMDATTLQLEKKAFSLIFNKSNTGEEEPTLSASIGSIQYIYSPTFIRDISLTFNRLKDKIGAAKERIKVAASDVAGRITKHHMTDISPVLPLKLDVHLDAPLLVLPCSSDSTRVVVAELGNLTVTNQTSLESSEVSKKSTDLLTFKLSEIKLVAIDVNSNLENQPQEIIFSDCGLQFSIQYDQSGNYLNRDSFTLDDSLDEPTNQPRTHQLSITGSVPHPLEMSLSRQAFESIQNSLAALSPDDTHASKSSSQINVEPDTQLSDSTTQDEEQQVTQATLTVNAGFTVPRISLQIKDQLGAVQNEGIIEVSFDKFNININKNNDELIKIIVQLTALNVTDLLQPVESSHRKLVRSIFKQKCSFKSVSAPNTPQKPWMSRVRENSPSVVSLPNSLTDGHISDRLTTFGPTTPPSSPVEGMTNPFDKNPESQLVTITIIQRLDKTSQQGGEDNSTQADREIQVNFNSLEVLVNQETWVMVLDFFGLGAKVISPEEQIRVNTQIKSNLHDQTEDSTKLDIQVNSLSLMLVKPTYELAKASISDVRASVVKTKTSTHIKGHLRDLSVKDLSPHGRLYHDRIIALSSENNPAFSFDVFKYDIPDQQLLRDFDASVNLNLVSVLYTHTKRYPIEILNFIQDLLEHHDKIGHMRAASKGQEVPMEPGHAPRIKMLIRADTPIIILPGSSQSNQAIVMHLGKLSLDNQFLYAGQPGTLNIRDSLKHEVSQTTGLQSEPMTQSMHVSSDDMMSYSIFLDSDEALPESLPEPEACLLDVMKVRLTEMDLYSAVRKPGNPGYKSDGLIQFTDYYISRDENRPLKDRCMLDLTLERNLDNDLNHTSPEIAIRGSLSSVHCCIDTDQYKLVRAVLDQNLGEDLIDLQRATRQSPQIQTVLTGQVWTVIDMSIDLHNVTVELLNKHSTDSTDQLSLARLDLIRSTLSFISYSNSSKDIDLASQRIGLTDTSPIQISVHKQILQSQESKDERLRMELHLRSGRNINCATILFNNTRIVCNAEWLVQFKEFLSQEPHKPVPKDRLKVSPVVASSFSSHDCIDYSINVPLTVKLNITGTEFVLVENLESPISRAIILKATTFTHYQPNRNKLLQCNLKEIELFSCLIASESSTALSIVDPFDVTIELVNKNEPTNHSKRLHVEMSVSEVAIKFSYNDLMLFKSILNAIPEQARLALAGSQNNLDNESEHQTADLTSNTTREDKSLELVLEYININWDKLDVCLINDAVDMDIPLLEVSVRDVCFYQHLDVPSTEEPLTTTPTTSGSKTSLSSSLQSYARSSASHSATSPNRQEFTLSSSTEDMSQSSGRKEVTFEDVLGGQLAFGLSMDYFNRELSGWEPVIEPWTVNLKWNGNPVNDTDVEIKVTSDWMMNVNVTHSFLQMIKQTNKLMSNELAEDKSRTRGEFVPYTLRNDTGRTLWFAILSASTPLATNWKEVKSSSCCPFFCDDRTKNRLGASRTSSSHRITVMVQGWKTTEPLSIYRVGQFCRTAKPDPHSSVGKMIDTRFVFDIQCQDNASKLITVRSPIVIHNQLSDAIEARLESIVDDSAITMIIESKRIKSIPSSHTFSDIWIRPAGNESVTYSDCKIVSQTEYLNFGQYDSINMSCNRTLDPIQYNQYRLCARLEKDKFPRERVLEYYKDTPLYQPGQTITLLPPLVIVNLLPVELNFKQKDEQSTGTKISSGKSLNLHNVDIEQELGLFFGADNYPTPGRLTLQPGCGDYLVPVRLHDTDNRLLFIDARITRQAAYSVKVILSAQYWLINQTGLPLVFRQHGTTQLSAGQFSENELARSVAPLMYSFSDWEQPELCSLRLGSSVHPYSVPAWSDRFSLSTSSVIRARVQTTDGRPDWTYNMGIEVKAGTGLYQDTKMITFVPYLRIINKTSMKLAFTQQPISKQVNCDYQVALPGSSQAYHWSRADLDQLMCFKILSIHDCMWSGGLRLDKLSSTIVIIRSSSSLVSMLVKVETVRTGMTFATIVSDASDLPPPMLIENYTDLTLKFWQEELSSEQSRTSVRPRTSVSYAWDEPILKHTLCLSIHCNLISATKNYDMDKIEKDEQCKRGRVENLEYENYFYISVDTSEDNLVFDVESSRNVVLSRKEPGKRSQLWSQNPHGRILHEGVSDKKSPHLCLDIMDLAVRPEGLTCLTLKKIDQRRQSTQIWYFEGGQLTCAVKTQCVQIHPAFGGSAIGAKIALGPTNSKNAQSAALDKDKMLPGSGMLSLLVQAKGPTRVLKIYDIQESESASHIKLNEVQGMMGNTQCQHEQQPQEKTPKKIKLAIDCKLNKGIGLSLINKSAEELLYLTLNRITLQFNHETSQQQLFSLQIRHVQIDNQLESGMVPIMYYNRPSSKSTSRSALELNWIRNIENTTPKHMFVFKSCLLNVSESQLVIDEVLLWKLLEMIGDIQSDTKNQHEELSSHFKINDHMTDREENKFYFGILKLICAQISLSVHTCPRLPPELQLIKRQALSGFSFLLKQFENAKIDIDPFIQVHPFETFSFLLSALANHFQSQILSNAPAMVASVDLIGNPLGLVNDVTTGISSFVTDGNAVGLFKNIAHGASDSFAKVAGTLSQGVGLVTMDEHHEESRQVIRKQYSGANAIFGGLRSLSHGLVGGLTSVPQQTAEGASQGGWGLATGLFKGVVGTVTKPVAGMLDFMSGAANSITQSTGGGQSIHNLTRKRPPRCCVRVQGLLEVYQLESARGQQLVYTLNNNMNMNQRHHERYLDSVILNRKKQKLLTTNAQLYILSDEMETNEVLLTHDWSEIIDFKVSFNDIISRWQLVLTCKQRREKRQPKFDCHDQEVADQAARIIEQSKSYHHGQTSRVYQPVTVSQTSI